MFFHLVAHSVEGSVLFDRWKDGLALWERIFAEVPDLLALCIMGNHVHMIHAADVRRRLAHALAAHVRACNSARDTRAFGIESLPPPEEIEDDPKRRRKEKYVYLNPVRAKVIPDPLAWPLSTYRDRLGLAAWPRVPVVHDPVRLHAWVSADSSVDVGGSRLPEETVQVADPRRVLDATSAVTRTPLSRMKRRGPARTLYLRAVAVLCPTATRAAAAALVGAGRHTAIRAAQARDPAVGAVARAVGDPRFPPLGDGDLRRVYYWPR